jgi:hypothetical protein
MRNKWTSGWDGNGFYCRVPSDQKADFHGIKTYSLSSKMTKLDYVMEVLSSCGLEDANFIAFIEATSLIDGHDVVEEFLACGPLANSMAFKWRQKNHPCLRFWCRCRISEAEFVAHIEKAKNELVGRYNLTEHNTYQGLQHGRLNRIFELAGILCQPRPEPIVHKMWTLWKIVMPWGPNLCSGARTG